MAVEGISARPCLDHNLHAKFARDLRRHGFDATFASEVGLSRATDEEHLRWATANERAIITYDQRDFRVLAEEWAANGEDHAGINIPQEPPFLSYGSILRRLLVLLDTLSADQLVNQVRWLDAGWDSDE